MVFIVGGKTSFMNDFFPIMIFVRSGLFLLAILGHNFAMEDLALCKLSHDGVDYRGAVSKSFSGPRCRFWDSIDVTSGKLSDKDFPDGSKTAAGNKCRNPTGQRLGPWCYTVDPRVVRDVCDVPLCSFKACRLSGPGVEYAGNLSVSADGERCLDWSGISKYRKHNPSVVRLTGRSFPDGSVKWAGRNCRNPDGDAGGPWCYVRASDGGGGDFRRRVRRAYCDVPLCDRPNCTVFTTYEEPQHSDFTHFNASGMRLRFSVRLWDPGEWKTVSARLALSLLATPGSGNQQLMRKTGFELVVSNSKIYFTGFEDDGVKRPDVLSASNWTHLQVTWGDEYITLLKEGEPKALLVQDFPTNKHTLDGLSRVTIKTLAISGRNILWNFPKCDDQCPVYVSSRETFSRLWLMRGSPTGYGVQLFVRSRSALCVQFRETPNNQYPGLRVCVDDHNNSSYVSYRTHVEATEIRLKEVQSGRLLSWWSWQELSISLSGSSLSLWTRTLSGPGVAVLETQIPEEASGSRWFSVSPQGGLALFTLFCIPEEEPALPTPPECLRSRTAPYVGTEWSTASGQPCLPWSDPDLQQRLPADLLDDSRYSEGSKEGARNYCRNPGLQDSGGPFCYGVRPHGSVVREPCDLRPCRTTDCRLAGTANDYMGTLSTSRSGLGCRLWAQAAPASLRNASLYPEQSLEDARNYCRNPSRSVLGAWCFTEGAVAADLCAVRDCEAAEECTVVYRGGRPRDSDKGGVYILPAWRERGLQISLKEWNPELSDGMVLDLRTLDGDIFHRLTIGAQRNEKVTFGFVSGGREELLSSKTIPHIVSAGRWAALWIRLPPGRVLLGLKGVDTPIFDWPYKQGDDFMPHQVSYHTLEGHAMGVQFDCSDCLIEQVYSSQFSKVYPWRLYRRDETEDADELRLYLQGSGTARLALYRLPDGPHLLLLIGGEGNAISLYQVDKDSAQPKELARAKAAQPLLQAQGWSLLRVTLQDKLVRVSHNGTEVLSWQSPSPLAAYYFSVAAERGAVSWAANCEPADISGSPRHGDWAPWGPWSCSAACGGGQGRRERSCSQPAPNILGRPCKGPAAAQGPCNEWPCGQLSPQSAATLSGRLQAGANQVHAEPGSRVRMTCGRVAVALVRQEAPDSRILWIKDGQLINTTADRRVRAGDEVKLSAAVGSDSGVWTCLAVRGGGGGGGARTVLAVWALSTPRRLSARLGSPLRLRCHAMQLALVYGHLQVRWTLNGQVFEVSEDPSLSSLYALAPHSFGLE